MMKACSRNGEVKWSESRSVVSNSLWLVHGILQARILEWVAFLFSRGSSQPRNRTGVSCIAGGFFTNWAIRKALCASVLIRKRQSSSPYKIKLVFYWYGLNCDHPLPTPNLHVEAITPSTSESDCIWRRVSKEMIKFKWGLRVGPNPTWPMSLEEEEMWTHWETTGAHMYKKATGGRMSRDHGRKQWRDGHSQARGRETTQATSPASTLILGFQPPKLWENKFLLFKPPSLGYFVMAPGDEYSSHAVWPTLPG